MQLFSRHPITTLTAVILIVVSPSLGARYEETNPHAPMLTQLNHEVGLETISLINSPLEDIPKNSSFNNNSAFDEIAPNNTTTNNATPNHATPNNTAPSNTAPSNTTPTTSEPKNSLADNPKPDRLISEINVPENTPSLETNTTIKTQATPPMERAELIKQRKIYQSAHTALKKGQRKTFRRQYKQLTTYPLKPYLRYYEIRRYLSSMDTQTISKFIDQNSDLAVIPHLKVAWLKQLATQNHWQEYLDFYQSSNYQRSKFKISSNTELQCLHIWAQVKTGNKAALAEAKPLWLKGKSQPSVCDPLFDAWKTSGHFEREYIWQRFELAMEKQKLGLATYLSNSFSGKNAAVAQEWLRLHRNPRRLSNTKRYLTDTEKSNASVIHGLVRLVSKSPEEAIALWATYESALSFTEPQQQKFSQALATILALRFHPAAAEWLIEANPVGNVTKLNHLAIRVALRGLHWNEVIILIQQLPKNERLESQWQYWYARALKELDISPSQNVEANLIFLQLAQSTAYYGFLSKEQSQLPFQFNPAPSNVSDGDLRQLESLPQVQRAREFYLLARPSDARREWAAAVSSLTDSQRLVAATLASQWGWHNQSIRSVAKTSLHHHINLRYPRAFQESVNYYAKSNELSNDWVYAIARQESLFTPDARSSAGALGMMQLLPSTAKLVARQIGAHYQGKKDLLQPKKNIRLGTSYMRQLLTRFNENTVLATAAYNAGPHRVKRWLPENSDLPADVWIETIPFSETRHYVKKVLTNRVIYKYQLGRKPELATSIPTIYSPLSPPFTPL